MKLDPEGLRRYAQRDWAAPERLARRGRSGQPIARKVELAVALYEAARSTGVYPNETQRRRDLEAHIRLRALLTRASDVGAR